MGQAQTNSAGALRSRWFPLLCLLIATSVSGLVWWRLSAAPAELPIDAVSRTDGWADEKRCAECHVEAEEFWETGHANTLFRVTDPRSRAKLERLAKFDAALEEGTRIEWNDEVAHVIQNVDGTNRELTLDWCFGSGLHAQTWVGTLSDSWGATDLVEYRWTWYHDIDDFDVTPGQPHGGTGGYFDGLGVLYDHPKTRRCFACHASRLTLRNGRIDQDSIHAGVTCQRCHGPRKRHIESEGGVIDGFWRTASQTESVNRCAQCHRRADEQKPEDVSTENVDIVRFQPVGLVQSACFRESPKMTCMTCHDPHRPLSSQDSLGIWQCVQCHDAAKSDQTPCRAGHLEDCLSCHMPRVRGRDPLQFTDHWIRIRTPGELSE